MPAGHCIPPSHHGSTVRRDLWSGDDWNGVSRRLPEQWHHRDPGEHRVILDHVGARVRAQLGNVAHPRRQDERKGLQRGHVLRVGPTKDLERVQPRVVDRRLQRVCGGSRQRTRGPLLPSNLGWIAQPSTFAATRPTSPFSLSPTISLSETHSQTCPYSAIRRRMPVLGQNEQQRPRRSQLRHQWQPGEMVLCQPQRVLRWNPVTQRARARVQLPRMQRRISTSPCSYPNTPISPSHASTSPSAAGPNIGRMPVLGQNQQQRPGRSQLRQQREPWELVLRQSPRVLRWNPVT